MPHPHLEPSSSRYPRFHIQDLDEARDGVQTLYGDLGVDLDRASFDWRATIATLGPLTLLKTSCDAGARLEGIPEAYILTLALSSGARASALRSEVDIVAGRGAAMFSAGEEMRWRAAASFNDVDFLIDPHFLHAQLEALTGEAVSEPLAFDLGLRTETGPGAYVERLCRFLVGEVEHGTPLDHPVLLSGIYENLARALLTGHGHSHSHLLEKPPPSSRSVVRRVEEYLDAHAAEPITTVDLVALTGASVPAIEAAFRQHRGTTPAGFLRARRLMRARQTILADPHLPLMRIACAAGFLRMETFEAAYFKAFQERPADTRARQAATSPPPAQGLLDRPTAVSWVASLSSREREVCERVARGMLNKQIAHELGISERTVKAHRERGMKKLGLGSSAELVRLFACLATP